VESLLPEDDEVEQQSIATFCLSPNGKEIVVATTRFSLAHYHIDTRECQRVIKAHRMPILSMDFDHTSTLVATGSADRSVKVWDILKGYCTHSFTNHTDIVKVVRFHPDPDKLALFSSSDDNSICMFDLRTSSCIAQFRDHVSLPSSLTFTHDGSILVSSGRDKVCSIERSLSLPLCLFFDVSVDFAPMITCLPFLLLWFATMACSLVW
jgi:U3 small nucleolar RNA-associated protein 13